jgi:uncharacterized protein (DUF952 family)
MSELRVIGFHGHVTPGRSPGLRGPVVVDAQDHFVHPDGEIDRDVTIADDAPLPGDGTRIGPWPYEPEKVVLVVDRPLLRKVRVLARRRGVTGDVETFLHAATVDGSALRASTAQQLGDVNAPIAWYASRANVDVLRVLLRDLALDDLQHEVASGGNVFVRLYAWQLQRSAVTVDDDLVAIAALEHSGLDKADVNELRDDLARDLPARARAARLEKARETVRGWKKSMFESSASHARTQARAPYETCPRKVA